MWAIGWITLLAVGAEDQDCAANSSACAARNSGNTFLQFASRVRHTENSTELSCDPFNQWPENDGVSCGGCQGLVKTVTYKRCDQYCESFGHRCVKAAEEENEDCKPKKYYGCDEDIGNSEDTSDMLCTCAKSTGAATCWASMNGVVNDEGNAVGMERTSSMEECEKACDEKDGCQSFTLCSEWHKCFLKDKRLSGSEPSESKYNCKSVYKTTCGSGGSSGGSGSGGGSGGGGSGGELQVKVVSYNLYWWNAFDQNSWKSDGIINNIKDNLRPDTIGFQECDSPSQISRRTGMLDKASKFEGAQGVMIRKNRFRASRAGSKDLDATGKWGPRYVTWVKLTDDSTGKHFWHFNTHWCVHSEGRRVCNEDVRYRGAKNMVRAIQDVAGDSPVVITGDFNARMREKGPRHFLDSGFKLAVNDWVDCIFYSHHWTLLQEGKGSSSGSDHKPVYAKLALK